MKINVPLFGGISESLIEILYGARFSKEHCVCVCVEGRLCGAVCAVRPQGLVAEVRHCLPHCHPTWRQHLGKPAAPHFGLHQPASHSPQSLLLEPPSCPSPPAWCRSSSALLGSAIWSRLLFNLFILLPRLLPPAPRWLPTSSMAPGTGHVSTPLDCELLQRDLGHRRVEPQHYSLPGAWLAINMCCCFCFLNK